MAVQDTVEDNEEKNRQKQSHFIYNYLTVRGMAWLCQGGSNIGYLHIILAEEQTTDVFVFSNLSDCVMLCYDK